MIHYVKHDGVDLPLKIGYGAMLLMQEETGISLSDLVTPEIATEKKMRGFEALFFYSLKGGHALTSTPFIIDRSLSIFIWEDHMAEFSEMIANVFKDSKKKGERV